MTTKSQNIANKANTDVNVKDYGATGDGVTDDAGGIQATAAQSLSVKFPPGTYTGAPSGLPTGTVFNANTGADLTGVTFNTSLVKDNRFSFGGDYSPTQGYLNHPAPNTANPYQSSLVVVRGTEDNPSSDPMYARTAQVVEMHSEAALTASQSVWGNPYMIPALTVEHEAYNGSDCNPNAGAFRAYSKETPIGTDSPRKNLTGISAIGQTNTGAGNDNWAVFGSNFIAAETSGNAADNCVCVEADVLHVNDATEGAGPSPGNNYTAFWAQSDADNVYSTAAFYASRTAQSNGWNYVTYAKTKARDWMAYLYNQEDDPSVNAGGMYIRTTEPNAEVLSLDATNGVGANLFQFRVNSSQTSAVSIKVGGQLKLITEGATNSGGSGYKVLRVPN